METKTEVNVGKLLKVAKLVAEILGLVLTMLKRAGYGEEVAPLLSPQGWKISPSPSGESEGAPEETPEEDSKKGGGRL